MSQPGGVWDGKHLECVKLLLIFEKTPKKVQLSAVLFYTYFPGYYLNVRNTHRAFRTAQYEFDLDFSSDDKSGIKLCVMATKFLGIKKGYQAMVALMELMQNGTVTQQELSRLSVNIFRFSQARAMSTVEDFLRNRSSWNDVMRSKVKWDCFSAWNEVDYKTTAKAA